MKRRTFLMRVCCAKYADVLNLLKHQKLLRSMVVSKYIVISYVAHFSIDERKLQETFFERITKVKLLNLCLRTWIWLTRATFVIHIHLKLLDRYYWRIWHVDMLFWLHHQKPALLRVLRLLDKMEVDPTVTFFAAVQLYKIDWTILCTTNWISNCNWMWKLTCIEKWREG